MSMEVIIALAILALVVVFWITYISSHSDASKYVSEFHANDLAILADLVAAAPGDIMISYDNLKTYDLIFDMKKDHISISKEGLSTNVSFNSFSLSTYSTPILNPKFLAFTKDKNTLRFSSLLSQLNTCVIATKKLSPELYVSSTSLDLITGLHKTLVKKQLTLKNDPTNFFIYAKPGDSFKITQTRDSLTADANYFSCLLEQQLVIYSPVQTSFAGSFNDVKNVYNIDIKSPAVATIITYPKDFDQELLGEIIGRSVIIYDR